MKKLTRRGFTAAGILAALGAGITALPGCRLIRCNVPETVYGPPEWFEPSNNEVVDVYGPPEDFEPDENEAVAVYGPPEWFEVEDADDGDDDEGDADDADDDTDDDQVD